MEREREKPEEKLRFADEYFGMQVKLEFEEDVGGVVRSKVIVG